MAKYDRALYVPEKEEEMSLVHFIEDPNILIANMQSGKPFALGVCGRPARKKSITVQPFMVSCPACAQILNDLAQQEQMVQENGAFSLPTELPAELPSELPLPIAPPRTPPLDLSQFLSPLLDLENPGRRIEDSEFIFNWGKTNPFMEDGDRVFVEGIAEFARMLGREGLANQLWSSFFRSVGRGVEVGHCMGLLLANVKTITTEIESGACDLCLAEMQKEEVRSKNRKGVVSAIERRMHLTQKGEGEE